MKQEFWESPRKCGAMLQVFSLHKNPYSRTSFNVLKTVPNCKYSAFSVVVSSSLRGQGCL